MVYAQIDNTGKVKNVIVLNDEKLIPVFAAGFEFFLPLTDEQYPDGVGRPGPGWTYDGTNFTPPSP